MLATTVRSGPLWTSGQRQACSLHEVSYRACFKPQLPAFFIERFSRPGDVVYDPFLGRGTTAVEAALLGRVPFGNDANPLSALLTKPRLEPPEPSEVDRRLERLPLDERAEADRDLSMFFERRTLGHIVSLKEHLARRRQDGREDAVDRWIRMVATNRLTGHSAGFFSVYTLPPNQAAGPEEQRRINRRLRQRPAFRDVRALIAKKTRSLLRDVGAVERERLAEAAARARFWCADARSTPGVPDAAVALAVTSPPFLDVVSYAKDNWLRGWFNGLDAEALSRRLAPARSLEAWEAAMAAALRELGRVIRAGGFVAFEVGEVRKGRLRLEESVLPLGREAGLRPLGVYINRQRFTKTANIWGVANNALGTNTNRIVLFEKP